MGAGFSDVGIRDGAAGLHVLRDGLCAYQMAMLSGTAERGALMMARFALATIPALALSSFGARSVTGHASGAVRVAIGLAIAAIGFAGTYLAPAALDVLCR